jgi:hypothetical protein
MDLGQRVNGLDRGFAVRRANGSLSLTATRDEHRTNWASTVNSWCSAHDGRAQRARGGGGFAKQAGGASSSAFMPTWGSDTLGPQGVEPFLSSLPMLRKSELVLENFRKIRSCCRVLAKRSEDSTSRDETLQR